MKHKAPTRAIALLGTFAFVATPAFVLIGCDTNDGVAEEAGESIDDAVDETGDAIDDAVDEVDDGIDG